MKKKLIALLTAIAVLPATLLAGTSPAQAAYNPYDVGTWIYPDTSVSGLNEINIYVCDAGTENNMPQDLEGATTGLNQFLQDNNCQTETSETSIRFNVVTEHKTILGILTRAYRIADEVPLNRRADFEFRDEPLNMAFRSRAPLSNRCAENIYLPGYHHTYTTNMPMTTYPYVSQGSLIVSMYAVNLNDVSSPAVECLANKFATYRFAFWATPTPNIYHITPDRMTFLHQPNLGMAWLDYRLWDPRPPVPETPKKSVVTHKTTSKILKRKTKKAKTVQVRFRATCKTTLRTSCTAKLGSYKNVKVRNLSTGKTYTLARHAAKRSPDYGRVKVTLRKGKNKLRITAPRHTTKTVTLTRR